MNRKGSLLIESLIALMILSVAISFIGRGLGPLQRMTDDAVIQQDLLDLGASVADEVLSGVISGNASDNTIINGKEYQYQLQFENIQMSGITTNMACATSTLPSTVTVVVAHATITTIDLVPARSLHFSVFPYY